MDNNDELKLPLLNKDTPTKENNNKDEINKPSPSNIANAEVRNKYIEFRNEYEKLMKQKIISDKEYEKFNNSFKNLKTMIMGSESKDTELIKFVHNANQLVKHKKENHRGSAIEPGIERCLTFGDEVKEIETCQRPLFRRMTKDINTTKVPSLLESQLTPSSPSSSNKEEQYDRYVDNKILDPEVEKKLIPFLEKTGSIQPGASLRAKTQDLNDPEGEKSFWETHKLSLIFSGCVALAIIVVIVFFFAKR